MPRRCAVCKICEENKAIDKIVHEDKFTQMLQNIDVLARIDAIIGNKISSSQLSQHYNKHLDENLYAEYKRQTKLIYTAKGRMVGNRKKKERANNINIKDASNILRFTPRSKFSFDLISNMREMYYELTYKFDEFRKNNEDADKITKDNLKFYSSIIEELRKIASDIVRVENNHVLVRDVLKNVLESGFKIFIKDIANIAAITSMDDDTREKLTLRLNNDIDTVLDYVDKELKGKF